MIYLTEAKGPRSIQVINAIQLCASVYVNLECSSLWAEVNISPRHYSYTEKEKNSIIMDRSSVLAYMFVWFCLCVMPVRVTQQIHERMLCASCVFSDPGPVINCSFLRLENDHETERASCQKRHVSIFKTTLLSLHQQPAFYLDSAPKGSFRTSRVLVWFMVKVVTLIKIKFLVSEHMVVL